MEAASLTELYNQMKKHIVQDCNFCGICVDVCPSVPLTSLDSMSAADIQQKAIDLLKDGVTSEEASTKVNSCTHCAVCQDVCPLDINPVILHELLRLELARMGQKRHNVMEIDLGDRILFLPDIIASMQIKPEEKRWISHIPDSPQHKDVVVFTGCGLVMMPDKIFLIYDILERLSLDFVIVAGGELCCGARWLGTDLDKADDHGKALLHALGAFQPEQVLLACAECAYQVAQYDKKITPAGFQYEELYHFLSRHIDWLGFKPVNKKVTLHEPCSISRALGDTTSLRTILKAIPELGLIEMSRNRQQSICCGGVASRKLPDVGKAMVRQCLEEAAKTGAEIMVDACQGCHFQFMPEESKYPFQVEHVLTLIGQAMGINYEDKIKKFYRYGDVDRVMAESTENITAGPYDVNFTALLAKRIFTRPTT